MLCVIFTHGHFTTHHLSNFCHMLNFNYSYVVIVLSILFSFYIIILFFIVGKQNFIDNRDRQLPKYTGQLPIRLLINGSSPMLDDPFYVKK